MRFFEDLALDHEGRLLLSVQPLTAETTEEAASDLGAFKKRLESSEAAALFFLEASPGLRQRSPSFRFWAEFTGNFLQLLCTTADDEVVPKDFALSKYCQQFSALPTVLGYEFLSLDYLAAKWSSLGAWIGEEQHATGESLRALITSRFPRWAEVGKIHFHLAENPTVAEFPFAFLATYAVRQSQRTRVQHMPLQNAIKGLMAASEHANLQVLLSPIIKAAEQSEFIHRLFQTKDLFKALPLTPERAYHFLESIPVLEQAGIIVKVPKLWAGGRPPRAKAQIAIAGPEGKSFVGFNGLLKFTTSLSINGEALSAKDAEDILASHSRLLFFRGRWIEVDRDRVAQILDRFAKAQRVAGESISFAEAMRLLSGAYGSQGKIPAPTAGDELWMETRGNDALDRLLDELKDPALLHNPFDESLLHNRLQATLRPYQQRGVQWLRFISLLGLGGCLADDMGLGKTVQVLALLLLESNRQPGHRGQPHLIVAPASLLGNWQRETEKFAPSLRFVIAHNSGDLNGERLKNGSLPFAELDLVITTYQMVMRLPWIQEHSWDCLVVDEAQAIKNADTATARAIKALNSRCRFALTGTPVENRLMDLWSILDFSCPGVLGTQSEFQKFTEALDGEQRAAKFSQFRRLITPFILRRKKTDRSIINDLPDKIERKVYCLLTPAQVSLYQAEVENLAKDLRQLQQDDKRRKGLILSYLTKFKQICNHPSHFLGNHRYDLDDSGKFLQTRSILTAVAANLEKVLIFTQYRELTDILAGLVEREFGEPALVLHGGTPVAKRSQLVEQFQSPRGPKHFILSLRAAGTGLNLTAASQVIHFDRWWNPAVEDQATDRAFRIGQKRNVLIHKLIVKGTIEERIDDMIDSKKSLAGEALGEKSEFKITGLSDEEILNLVHLDLKSAMY